MIGLPIQRGLWFTQICLLRSQSPVRSHCFLDDAGFICGRGTEAQLKNSSLNVLTGDHAPGVNAPNWEPLVSRHGGSQTLASVNITWGP